LGGELLGGRVLFLLQLIVPFSELHVGLVLVGPEADGADQGNQLDKRDGAAYSTSFHVLVMIASAGSP